MISKASNNNQVLWVAIDIAKNKHVILIEHPNGTNKQLSIMNSLEDFNRLAAYLKRDGLSVIIGMEATGHYHRPIAYFLLQQSFELRLISTVAAARVREAQFNAWDKNDPKDARVLLYLLKSGISQYYHDPMAHQMVDLQEIANTYRQVSLRKARLQNSITGHYISLYFPEAEKYFCSTRAEWFAKFFYQFPCPSAITKHSLEEFVALAWKPVGRKVDKENWLKDLYATAQKSVGIPVQSNSKAMEMFKLILMDFAHLCQRRSEIEDNAEEYLKENNDYRRLRTIPGIGPIITLVILSESGNLRRFSHWRQYIKFCGFDLCTHQSGQFRGKTKLSKRGNNHLRQAFWMASTVAIRMRENTFRKKFENYIKKDPTNADLKRKAYTAVAAKMAKVAHSLIKNEADYLCTHAGA